MFARGEFLIVSPLEYLINMRDRIILFIEKWGLQILIIAVLGMMLLYKAYISG